MTLLARKPTLVGERVRLRPFREDDTDALWTMLNDQEGRFLTGTHAAFTREASDRWYRTRADQDDRLDLAIATLGADDCVGEVVLNDLDTDNRSCSFRISLIGPSVFGRGYGTEATHLMLHHAFETVGLHRVELEVYSHNPRAQHVYASVGFVAEGVRRDALAWEGSWYDATFMSILAPEWRGRSSEPG